MPRTDVCATAASSNQLKRNIVDVSLPLPFLQGLTFVVSLLHTVFDLLAFKNDIGFWKNNKSMEGLSARTVVINAFCQVRDPPREFTRLHR